MARQAKKVEAMPPTPEQMKHGDYAEADIVDKAKNGVNIVIGKAFKRKPMIETLFAQGLFSEAEYKALKHYRHHADIADRSPLRDSLANIARITGGAGMGPTVTTLNAIRVASDCERAAGSLVDILRSVVVYDSSLSQWAMHRDGSIEKCRQRGSKRVCRIEPTEKSLMIARLDIQMAAKRVESELSA